MGLHTHPNILGHVDALSGSMPLLLAFAPKIPNIILGWCTPILMLILCLLLSLAFLSIPALRTLSLPPDIPHTRYRATGPHTNSSSQHDSPIFSIPRYAAYHLGVARLVIIRPGTVSQYSAMYYVGAFGRWWTWNATVHSGYTQSATVSKSLLPSPVTPADDTLQKALAALGKFKSQVNQRKAELRVQIRQLQETQRLHESRCQQLEHEQTSMRNQLAELYMARDKCDSLTLPVQMKIREENAAERTKAYEERRTQLVQRIVSAQNRSAELQHHVSTLQARVDAMRSQVNMNSRLSTPSPMPPPLEPDTASLYHLLPSNLLSSDDSFNTLSTSLDLQNSPPTPNGSTIFPSGTCLLSLNPRAKEFTSSRSIRPDAGYSESLASPLPLYHLI